MFSVSILSLSHYSGRLLLFSTSQIQQKHLTAFNFLISMNGVTSVPVLEVWNPDVIFFFFPSIFPWFQCLISYQVCYPPVPLILRTTHLDSCKNLPPGFLPPALLRQCGWNSRDFHDSLTRVHNLIPPHTAMNGHFETLVQCQWDGNLFLSEWRLLGNEIK